MVDPAPNLDGRTDLRPSVWWRPPGQANIYTLIPDDDGTSTFHFAPFEPTEAAPELRWSGHVVRSQAPQTGTLPHPSHQSPESTNEDWHLTNVNEAIKDIERGTMQKVVLSRTLTMETSIAPEEAFMNLCRMHPNAMVYLMHDPDHGTWCGATPELLLRAHHHDLDTVSLAGTRPADVNSDWTDKERKEQQLVTDHIVATLQLGGAQHIVAEETSDRKYGNLLHLETRISAHYPGSMHEMAQALHPTPAVCGMPVHEAKSFIQSNEKHERLYYSGFLGWSSPMGCSYYVNLRCARWVRQGVQLFAGGGIVEGSNAQSEWRETEDKLLSIKSAFQD